MVKRPKAWMSWSSGKDSATALHAVRVTGEYEVTALLCTVNADANRVAMHAVRRSLLEAQARALDLPLVCADIPCRCPNEVYEEQMRVILSEARADGVTHMVFGDLFLRNVRAYREERLESSGITPVFPLWDLPTGPLAKQMLASGLQAVVTCVDTAQLDRAFAGRAFDAALLDELPVGVDPCGENGEFHTFVSNSPDFHAPIAIRLGRRVERNGFAFCDVHPISTAHTT